MIYIHLRALPYVTEIRKYIGAHYRAVVSIYAF